MKENEFYYNVAVPVLWFRPETFSLYISVMRDMLEERAILLWNTRAEKIVGEQEGDPE